MLPDAVTHARIMTEPRPATQLDRLAIVLSGACLVHCLAIPVCVLLLPALAEGVLGTETTVHWVLLGFALPISIWALTAGYRRHRYTPSLCLGGVGLTCMFVGVSHWLSPDLEVPLTILGVTLVLVAHVQNLRRSAHRHRPLERAAASDRLESARR